MPQDQREVAVRFAKYRMAAVQSPYDRRAELQFLKKFIVQFK